MNTKNQLVNPITLNNFIISNLVDSDKNISSRSFARYASLALLALLSLSLLIFFQSCASHVGEPRTNKDDDAQLITPQGFVLTDGVLKSWDDPFPKGIKDANCFQDPKYNLCLIEKNPVFAAGTNFTPALTIFTSNYEQEKQIFTLGLKVPTTGTLENKNFKIIAPNVLAKPQAGSWKFSLGGDNHHFVSQIQTFYWLNQLVSQVELRTGRFFFAAKRAPVHVYVDSLKNNANFDGTGINLGYRNNTEGKGDVALDISVTVHEAGHGNLYFASKLAQIDDVCLTENGCFGAIHEGVGDITAFMFLNTNSTVGEYFINNINGLRSPARTLQAGKSANDYFKSSSGSVHQMGKVYSAIWYSLWTLEPSDRAKQLVEILFTNHLPTLQANDNFVSAYANIMVLIPSIFPDPAPIKAKLTAIYKQFGITI